jgi:sugar phosphate isomerase/epimerase
VAADGGVERVRIGIGSYAFRWAIGTRDWVPSHPLTPAALLDKAAALHAKVVQICDNMPLETLPEPELDALARRATDLGLALEVGIRGSQPTHVRRNLAVAQRLGARLLRVVLAAPGWQPPFDEVVTFLRGMLPELRAAGVALAIENRFTLSPAELARLVQVIDDPLVGVCLDPLNSITQLVGVGETVRTLAPFALSVHAKDAVITRPGTGFYISGCPLGEGLVDLVGMLDAVRAAGRSPNVLVECWMDPLEDEAATLSQEEAWVRDGIAYLRRCLV